MSLLKRYHRDGRFIPPPPSVIIDDEPEWEAEHIDDLVTDKSSADARKVQHLIKFSAYGPEHNMWQNDLSNCMRLVSKYWASKPESERLFVSLIQ